MRFRLLVPLLVSVAAYGQGTAPGAPPEGGTVPPGSGIDPSVAPPSTPSAATSATSAGPDVFGSAPVKKTDVPDTEKLKRSSDGLSRMRTILKDVLAKLEEARASKDVVKLNCVNEKLTQIKGLLRITEQADVALQEAIARQERQAADHEYLKITIAQQKVEQLRAESEECIGQLAFRTDERQEVTVEEPDGLPDDPTSPPVPSAPVTRPPPASPSL